jgi:hypothetical protein
MTITSISAIGGGYNYATAPYTPPPASTRTVTQLATGATVTTIRGTTGDVLAVSTAVAAAQSPSAAYGQSAQNETSTFYVTA